MEEKLKEVLEKIAFETKVVYHKVNKKIIENNELSELVFSAISASTPVFTYVSEKSSYGEMTARVYIFGNVAVVCEQWQPNFGYSWEEEKITLIKLKSPSD